MKNQLFIVLLLLITTNIYSQEEMKKVAVFDPAGDVPNNLKIMVREELSNAFVNTLGFTVLERELINKVLQESQFQLSGHVDENQIGELGRKMGANYVCYATISIMGSNYYISCKMVDVKTARIERQNTGITRNGMNDLFDVTRQISRSMLLGTPGANSSPVSNGYENTEANTNTTTKSIEKSTVIQAGEIYQMNVNNEQLFVMPQDIQKEKISYSDADNLCKTSTEFGYNDWRLPTKEEATQMFINKKLLGTFQRYWYWTSSEHGKEYYRQAFDLNKSAPAVSQAKSFARCVRSNNK